MARAGLLLALLCLGCGQVEPGRVAQRLAEDGTFTSGGYTLTAGARSVTVEERSTWELLTLGGIFIGLALSGVVTAVRRTWAQPRGAADIAFSAGLVLVLLAWAASGLYLLTRRGTLHLDRERALVSERWSWCAGEVGWFGTEQPLGDFVGVGVEDDRIDEYAAFRVFLRLREGGRRNLLELGASAQDGADADALAALIAARLGLPLLGRE